LAYSVERVANANESPTAQKIHPIQLSGRREAITAPTRGNVAKTPTAPIPARNSLPVEPRSPTTSPTPPATMEITHVDQASQATRLRFAAKNASTGRFSPHHGEE
jgi:hypothetical protein